MSQQHGLKYYKVRLKRRVAYYETCSFVIAAKDDEHAKKVVEIERLHREDYGLLYRTAEIISEEEPKIELDERFNY